MSTTSALLRMTLQAFDENPNTWGQILNDSALQLLEDGVAGTADIELFSAVDYELTDVDGATAEARYMILDINGSTGDATNIIVPTRSKVYLVSNTTGSTITVKTVAGTGPEIIDGEAQWVFCDGTNVLAASAATATSAGTAATATNALSLIGVAGADYANKNLAGIFQAGQVSQRTAVVLDTGNLNIDCALGNTFYHVTTAAFTLTAPTNATNGQVFTLVIEQGGGGPHAINYQASTFQFAGGSAPVLSTVAGNADYFAFEYVSSLSGGARWFGSQLKNMADV